MMWHSLERCSWNHALCADLCVTTSTASLWHRWRSHWVHCVSVAIFLSEISIWLGICKQRMQSKQTKKSDIELVSKQGNALRDGGWATRSSCMLTISPTRGIWSWHWQHWMPLAVNALYTISRSMVVWTLPTTSFPRNEQKNLHHFWP